MNIGNICQCEAITVGPELDLREAAELMREHHVGCPGRRAEASADPSHAAVRHERQIEVLRN